MLLLLQNLFTSNSGEEEACKLYTDLYDSPPAWGLSGENNEDLTRHIMCCSEEPEEPPPEQPEGGEMLGDMLINVQEQTVLDVFKAQWFGRNEGYQGTSYADAEKFCSNVAGMDLCELCLVHDDIVSQNTTILILLSSFFRSFSCILSEWPRHRRRRQTVVFATRGNGWRTMGTCEKGS